MPQDLRPAYTVLDVETLVSEGRIIIPADIDPTNTYIKVGVWMPNNRKAGGDGSAYSGFVIPLSAILSGGGGGSDKNYVYTQGAPSTTWVVNHNLGKRVAVNVTNLSGVEIGGEVIWNSDNQVTINFNQPVAGFVYCN